MSSSLAAVRAGMKRTLETVSGLQAVYGYVHPSPSPPCAIVGWPQSPVDLQPYLGNPSIRFEATIPVRVLVTMSDNQNADVNLGDFCELTGSTSIYEAFANDSTLGGLDVEAVVSSVTDFGPITLAEGGLVYLACTFLVVVI